MNEHAELWVAKLRSGEFTQGHRRLRDGDFYCCLGVACELYRQEVGGKWVELYEGMYRFVDDSGSWSSTELPATVTKWLGLRTESGKMNSVDISLIAMNDNGREFKGIADIIEREPPGLFS